MGLKVCMGGEHHRYYKHTKFHQNPRSDPKFLVDLTQNDPFMRPVLHKTTTIGSYVSGSLPASFIGKCEISEIHREMYTLDFLKAKFQKQILSCNKHA